VNSMNSSDQDKANRDEKPDRSDNKEPKVVPADLHIHDENEEKSEEIDLPPAMPPKVWAKEKLAEETSLRRIASKRTQKTDWRIVKTRVLSKPNFVTHIVNGNISESVPIRMLSELDFSGGRFLAPAQKPPNPFFKCPRLISVDLFGSKD
jgi:hypothetical protein